MTFASLKQDKTFIQCKCETVKRWGVQLSHVSFLLQKIWWSEYTYMSKHHHVSQEWDWLGVWDAISLQDRIGGSGVPVTNRKLLSQMCCMVFTARNSVKEAQIMTDTLNKVWRPEAMQPTRQTKRQKVFLKNAQLEKQACFICAPRAKLKQWINVTADITRL